MRSSGFDYVIVRSPSLLQKSRPGSEDDIELIGRSGSQAIQDAVSVIGSLDLAEAVVQSLLLESVDKKTFTPVVVNGNVERERVRRSNYYRILSLDGESDEEDSRREMRKTYMIRKSESNRDLVTEDIAVEEFWEKKLIQIPID